jgi:glycosyltransferase involved in cell wall biosynthesis
MIELAKALPSEIRSAFILFSETGLYRAFLHEVKREGFDGIALKHDTPRLLAALRELVSVLRSVRADLLYCHEYKSNLLGLLAARWLRIPVISVSRGWTGECARVRFYEALDRRVLRWMDKVVCVSEAQAQKVRRAGVGDHKVAVIRNAVRPERFDNPDVAYRGQLLQMFPEPPRKIVGAAGRLSPEKGFGVLVDAASSVIRSQPDAGFVLFGDGPLRERLTRQIAARGLEGKFLLAGFRSDLDKLVPHLDLMVLPSFSEGLPNVVLESLAAGVPVVATAVGGTPEIVEHGVTGCLVPPGNADALARCMIDVLSNGQSRKMGVCGRDHIREHFSFTSQALLYQRLFDGLVSNDHELARGVSA